MSALRCSARGCLGLKVLTATLKANVRFGVLWAVADDLWLLGSYVLPTGSWLIVTINQ